MKYIKFFFVVGLLCSFLDSASAQRLVVFSVSGGPQLVTTNGNTSIKAYDELTMESTINIPYDASLELLDETAKKHYVLKTPGRDKISAFVQNKKNGVGELSMRYFQYMQNQLKGGAKLAARRHSDPATVTREKQEYVEEDDWEKEFRDFSRSSEHSGEGSRELMRISNIITDNISKGVELTDKLQSESETLWLSRKRSSEERGRLAETKLTMPLTVFLLVLVVVTVSPALLEL